MVVVCVGAISPQKPLEQHSAIRERATLQRNERATFMEHARLSEHGDSS